MLLTRRIQENLSCIFYIYIYIYIYYICMEDIWIIKAKEGSYVPNRQYWLKTSWRSYKSQHWWWLCLLTRTGSRRASLWIVQEKLNNITIYTEEKGYYWVGAGLKVKLELIEKGIGSKISRCCKCGRDPFLEE